jgi:hypothetical protein
MLRKPLFSAVARTCLVSSAFAADLPSRTAPPPAPYISGAGRHLDRLLYRCECRCHVQRLVIHRADAVVGFRAFPVRLRLRTSDRRLSHVPDHPAHQLHRWRTGRLQLSIRHVGRRLRSRHSGSAAEKHRIGDASILRRRRRISARPCSAPRRWRAGSIISALHAGASGCPLVLRCSMQRAVWLTAAPILLTGTIGFPIAPTVVLSGTSSNSRTSLG